MNVGVSVCPVCRHTYRASFAAARDEVEGGEHAAAIAEAVRKTHPDVMLEDRSLDDLAEELISVDQAEAEIPLLQVWRLVKDGVPQEVGRVVLAGAEKIEARGAARLRCTRAAVVGGGVLDKGVSGPVTRQTEDGVDLVLGRGADGDEFTFSLLPKPGSTTDNARLEFQVTSPNPAAQCGGWHLIVRSQDATQSWELVSEEDGDFQQPHGRDDGGGAIELPGAAHDAKLVSPDGHEWRFAFTADLLRRATGTPRGHRQMIPTDEHDG